MSLTAKLTIENGEQVVRLPRGVQLPGKDAFVRIEGDALVLRPRIGSWDDFFARHPDVPDDFLSDRVDLPPEPRNPL